MTAFRRATAADLPAILALLADDQLGAGREDPADAARYRAAFDLIDADPAQMLAVAQDGDRVVGTLQLTFIPGLARGGECASRRRATRSRLSW